MSNIYSRCSVKGYLSLTFFPFFSKNHLKILFIFCLSSFMCEKFLHAYALVYLYEVLRCLDTLLLGGNGVEAS